MTDKSDEPDADAEDAYRNKSLFVRLGAFDRLKLIARNNVVGAISVFAGFLSGVLVSIDAIIKLYASLRKLLDFHRAHSGSLDIISSAYAATDVVQLPVFSGALKSVILSGIFIALFVLFIWALFTLSKSPNPKAVDVAGEAIKTLAGFFIGALTGFLGA